MPVPTALPKPRCQCLTSLSEPARKVALEACSWHLWSLQLTALAAASETGKHRGMPVPTALPKPRCQCLFWARQKSSPWSLQLTALAAASETGKHRGMPVPTALPKPPCQCLASLSEPARKVALEACSWQLWRPPGVAVWSGKTLAPKFGSGPPKAVRGFVLLHFPLFFGLRSSFRRSLTLAS